MIRHYENRDFDGCVRLVNRVWQFDKHFSPPALSDFFMKTYTGSSLAGSNFSLVIEESDEIKGFLFGKTEKLPLHKNEYSGVSGQFRLLHGLFRLKGVTFKRKWDILNKLNTHELNRRKVESRKSSEVNLFVVDPDSQGKGFGKQLISGFIDNCKANNVKRIVLETDAESNYGFYLHLGFKKMGQFYSPMQEEYSRGSGETFVYEMIL